MCRLPGYLWVYQKITSPSNAWKQMRDVLLYNLGIWKMIYEMNFTLLLKSINSLHKSKIMHSDFKHYCCDLLGCRQFVYVAPLQTLYSRQSKCHGNSEKWSDCTRMRSSRILHFVLLCLYVYTNTTKPLFQNRQNSSMSQLFLQLQPAYSSKTFEALLIRAAIHKSSGTQ